MKTYIKTGANNTVNTNIRMNTAQKLIGVLKELDGAVEYDGDASTQVVFPLANGKTLRIGVTDDDVGSGKLWIDQYPGLKIQGAPNGDLTDGFAAKYKNK